MNYYKRHLGDYARDTGHLSALEHGIYCLLLDYYYSTEKPIPKDRAHRIARANPEQTQTVCEEFFKSDGDVWRHSYADRQIEEYNAKADINRLNGTKGGRPASQVKPTNNPTETQSVNSGNLSHKPLAISQEPLKDRGAKRATQFPVNFSPNENNKSVSEEMGVDLQTEIIAFADFHKSKGSTFKDWNLALNTWIRNSKKFSKSTSRFPTLDEKMADTRARAMAMINKETLP